jgi:hypothetical protein
MFLVFFVLFVINSNNVTYLDSLYKAGNYSTVVVRGEEFFAQETNKENKVEILKVVAFANVALDLKDRAKENFLTLLTIVPKYDLDPVRTSPKIIEVFQAAKVKFTENFQEKKKTVKFDPLIYFYPGLSQIHNERKAKGYLFLSLGTTSLLGFIATSILTPIYRQKYLDQEIPSEIDIAYNQYKSVYIARQIFGSGIIFSYGVHILDIKFFEPH